MMKWVKLPKITSWGFTYYLTICYAQGERKNKNIFQNPPFKCENYTFALIGKVCCRRGFKTSCKYFKYMFYSKSISNICLIQTFQWGWNHQVIKGNPSARWTVKIVQPTKWWGWGREDDPKDLRLVTWIFKIIRPPWFLIWYISKIGQSTW